MAHFDNLSTKEEQARTELEYREGWNEGYNTPLNPLPAIAYKIPRDWTAREQGYALGWLMKRDELKGAG